MDNTFRDLQNSSYPTEAEFNNCFIIYSKQFQVLKEAKTCLPRSMLSHIDSASLLASLGDNRSVHWPANILQIADVVRRGVVFAMILENHFGVKRVKCFADCSAILFILSQQLNLLPRFSRLTVQ